MERNEIIEDKYCIDQQQINVRYVLPRQEEGERKIIFTLSNVIKSVRNSYMCSINKQYMLITEQNIYQRKH